MTQVYWVIKVIDKGDKTGGRTGTTKSFSLNSVYVNIYIYIY